MTNYIRIIFYDNSIKTNKFNNLTLFFQMVARIFKTPKTAMQSGMAQSNKWVLELEHDMEKSIEPLMGWTGSSDTRGQIQLRFKTKELAITYAKKYQIPYTILTENTRKHIIRENGYGDNFSYDKKIPWTH